MIGRRGFLGLLCGLVAAPFVPPQPLSLPAVSLTEKMMIDYLAATWNLDATSPRANGVIVGIVDPWEIDEVGEE